MEKGSSRKIATPPEHFHNGYVNVRWSVQTDLLDAENGSPLVVPMEHVSKAGAKVGHHEYYASQKSMVA